MKNTAQHTTFAVYINDRLSASNVTPEALAVALGYRDPNLIKLWMTGKIVPPGERLPDLATHLDLPFRDLALRWLAARYPACAEAVAQDLQGAGSQ